MLNCAGEQSAPVESGLSAVYWSFCFNILTFSVDSIVVSTISRVGEILANRCVPLTARIPVIEVLIIIR